MNNRTAIFTISISIILMFLTGCANTADVSAERSDAHGVLSKSVGAKANSVYPVNILQVGEDDTFASQANILVIPGSYVLRVAPEDFRVIARNENIRLQGNDFPAFDELVREMPITVVDGRRYFIGAQFVGPTLYDWKPVVVRVETLD